MKPKIAYAIVKRRGGEIRILDIYVTRDVEIDEDERWATVEIKEVKKTYDKFNKRTQTKNTR